MDEINLLNLDAFDNGFPHHWFTWLRQHDPVHLHPEPDGPGFWVLSKHADILTVSRSPQLFSSAAENSGVLGLDDQTVKFHSQLRQGTKFFLTMDPPEQTRFRLQVSRGFMPRAVARLEDGIRAVVASMLDQAVEERELDLVPSLSAPLPLHTIAELAGWPLEDRPLLMDLVNRQLAQAETEYQGDDDDIQRLMTDMSAYIEGLCEKRRKQPAGDIISVLLDSELDGTRLTFEDVRHTFHAILVAGSDTTRNTISHAVRQLAEHPGQYRDLVADPGLIPGAVEEFLRWASPVGYFRRTAMEDVEIRGRKIPAGGKVTMWYASGNRDEDVFDDPFRFDIHRRQPIEHIAFGGGGPHFCMGASLARLELRVFFEELVSRVSSIEMLSEPAFLRSNLLPGIQHLHVRLNARAGDLVSAR